MTSLFRPLLTSLLCCTIAFGQLPALLHVATCDGHRHCELVGSEEEPSDACTHACQSHPADDDEANPSGQTEISHMYYGEESPAVPLHDSDHCVVCHSLANPVGIVWDFELPLVHESLSELASVCVDCLPVDPSVAIPQPRGPPAVA